MTSMDEKRRQIWDGLWKTFVSEAAKKLDEMEAKNKKRFDDMEKEKSMDVKTMAAEQQLEKKRLEQQLGALLNDIESKLEEMRRLKKDCEDCADMMMQTKANVEDITGQMMSPLYPGVG